jgi:hypothetical protein
MLHSRSLRIIGQALEASKVASFKIAARSDVYRVFVGDVMFRFDAAALSRVSALVQANKPNMFVLTSRVRPSLSEQLRAVGGFTDRMEVDEFRIVWTQNFAILDYEEADAELMHRVFTAEELQKLALHPPLPRSVSYFPLRLGYWS